MRPCLGTRRSGSRWVWVRRALWGVLLIHWATLTRSWCGAAGGEGEWYGGMDEARYGVGRASAGGARGLG